MILRGVAILVMLHALGPIGSCASSPTPRAACWGLPRAEESTELALEPVFRSVDLGYLGVQLVPHPTSGWYAVRFDGIVSRIEGDTIVGTFLDISDRVSVGSQWGLQSLALHPAFEKNGEVYVSYTSQRPGDDAPKGFTLVSTVSRFHSADGGRTVDPTSEVVLLREYTLKSPPWHPIAQLGFGPDGFLYIGWGESVKGGQDRQSFAGKMLRIDVTPSSDRPYRIPEDNPFVAGGARPEIFALGLRNPWRWSFDRETAKLWVGDVGSDLKEEVDVVEAGKNYGWPFLEGNVCRMGPELCRSAEFTPPVLEVPRAESCAIVGGYVYRGRAIPELRGVYLYADFCGGAIWGLVHHVPKVLVGTGNNVTSLAEDREGEIYVIGYSKDRTGFHGFINRLVKAQRRAAGLPHKFSETGCARPGDLKRPAANVFAYEVNAPAWSNGASAERWIALPPYGPIRAGDQASDWVAPRGSTIVQNLAIDGRLVETRLLVHGWDGGWGAYGYEWDTAQTDATLVTEHKVRSLGGGRSWIFPSPNECLQCHTAAANRALGLNTPQMHRNVVDSATGKSVSQIAMLMGRGWLTKLFPEQGPIPIPDARNRQPTIAKLDEAGETVERRARAYLHANCAHCHRPGTGVAAMDLRFDVPDEQTGVCDVVPLHGDLGIADARLVAPGDPVRSVVARRLRATDGGRMPPVGVSGVDEEGASLIDAWIRAGACRHTAPPG